MDPALAIEVAASSRTETINRVICEGDSDIQRFYKNSVVFVTGGSGFLGKQLIEKLFRSCNISKMYLLLRPKKGKKVRQRLDDIFKESVFDSLHEIKPDFMSKIVPVEGDVSELRLGLRDQNWKTLTEEVNVIFHVAATTKFDETVRVATLINVRGTREALALGKACKNLKSYVHVSTAYTHATTMTLGQEVPEDFCDAPISPTALISMAEDMEASRLTNITPMLIKNWPNTYTFSKAVAEDLVKENSLGLPICIVRPGIVLCSYSEPCPGWIDPSCVYGATGFLFGLGLGLVHTLLVRSSTVLGFIPCDTVNNAIIAAGRETATSQTKGGSDTRIYTVSTTNRNPITWMQLKQILVEKGSQLPTPSAFYYAYGYETNCKLLYMLLSLFLHIIPAYGADLVCLLIGKERRFAKMAKKLYNMCNVLSFFLINEWKFVDNNLSRLYSNLSKDDQTIFNFDVMNIDLTEYMELWFIGTRKYIVKDGLKYTKYAIQKQKVLRVIHYILMSLYVYGLWKLAWFAAYTHATRVTIGKKVSEGVCDTPIAPEALISMTKNMGGNRISIAPIFTKMAKVMTSMCIVLYFFLDQRQQQFEKTVFLTSLK